jgi:hypothetical protein
MWAKPQHNPSATIATTAITPKYLNFCRMDRCCVIAVQADRKTAPRLSKTAHFGFSCEVLTSRSMMQAGR